MNGKLKWFAVIFLSVIIFLPGGCRTSSSDEQPSAEPDIFIAGFTRNGADVAVPCYWKNGARTELSVLDGTRDGFAWSITGYGSDVYTAGATTNSFQVIIPCYWRNGGRSDLSVLVYGKGGEAHSIFTLSK